MRVRVKRKRAFFIFIYNTVAQVVLVSVTQNYKFQHLTVPPVTTVPTIFNIHRRTTDMLHIWSDSQQRRTVMNEGCKTQHKCQHDCSEKTHIRKV